MKDIYIYRIGHLGDTLVALPAIKKIRESHENDNLILITSKPEKDHYVTAWDVLRHTGFFEEAVFYSAKDGKSVLELIRRLRGGERESLLYYLVVDVPRWRLYRDYFFFRVLCGLNVIGFKGAIGKRIKRDGSGRLVRLDKESVRIMKQICVAPTFEAGEMPSPPFIFPPGEAQKKADEILGALPDDKMLIAVGFGAKGRAQEWPEEKFRELCSRIVKHGETIVILLIGGRSEHEAAERIMAGNERIINLAGKTDIVESACLLKRCALFIGNDSGPMHLAAAVGTPTVGIFSARNNPGRWEPFGEGHVIIRKEVECAGCFLNVCIENKMKCIDMISVEEVFEAASEKITEGKGQWIT